MRFGAGAGRLQERFRGLVRRATLSHRPGCGDLTVDSFAGLPRRAGTGNVPRHLNLSSAAASPGDGRRIYLDVWIIYPAGKFSSVWARAIEKTSSIHSVSTN